MTKKDYIVLANALKNARPLVGGTVFQRTVKSYQWLSDVEAVARALQENNPKFDVHTWLKACGVTSS